MRSRVGWPGILHRVAPAHRRTQRIWWSPRHRQARLGTVQRLGLRLVAMTMAVTVAGGGSFAWARTHSPVIVQTAQVVATTPAPAPVVDCCASPRPRNTGGLRIPLWRVMGIAALHACAALPASAPPVAAVATTATGRKAGTAASRKAKAVPVHHFSLSDIFPTPASTCTTGSAPAAPLPGSPLPLLPLVSPAASATGAGH